MGIRREGSGGESGEGSGEKGEGSGGKGEGSGECLSPCPPPQYYVMYLVHDISVRQHSKSEHRTPCHIQTPS